MKKKLFITLLGAAAIAGASVAAIALPRNFKSSYAGTTAYSVTFDTDSITDITPELYMTLSEKTSSGYDLVLNYFFANGDTKNDIHGPDYICDLVDTYTYGSFIVFEFQIADSATLTSIDLTGSFDGETSATMTEGAGLTYNEYSSSEGYKYYQAFFGDAYNSIRVETLTVNYTC